MDHKLFNQLMAAQASDEEVAELYQDLYRVIEQPFDTLIHEAVSQRRCVYIVPAKDMASQ